MGRRGGPVLFCLVAIWLLFSAPLAAQEPPTVQVQANEARVHFPEEIAFHLDLAAPSPVDRVELEYGMDRTSCGESSVRVSPDVTPDSQQPGHLLADWTLKLRRSGPIPPGARLWWRWRVTTGSGETWSSPVEWVLFEDDRHAWQTQAVGQIAVHWYEGGEEFGQEMLQAAVDAQARLTADPGANLEKPVHLYFYATAEDLQDALVFSQRWTGGVAFPDYYTVLIAADPDSLDYGRRTVAHELMHLVVHQLAFNCWSDLPTWLDEGLASWAEGEPDADQEALLAEAIAGNRLLSLRGLGGSFSAHAGRAGLAYAQSYSVVNFLIEEYGREKALELLAAFRRGASYDGALQQVYGFDTDGLEDRWRAKVGAQPRPTAAARGTTPTAVPTLALWQAEPTIPWTTATPVALSTPRPTATGRPQPTAMVAGASPTVTVVTAVPASPVPAGEVVEGTGVDRWLYYTVGGGAVLMALLLGVGAIRYARHRGGKG